LTPYHADIIIRKKVVCQILKPGVVSYLYCISESII
jgi:hypothetical protein